MEEPPMNLRILSVITTGISVFLLVLLLSKSCDKPQTKPQDTTLWREKVEQHKDVIREKDSIIYAQAAIIDAKNKKHSKDSTRLTKVATVNFNRYKQAVAEVQHLRDSFPQVNTLILAADSALAAKDSLYTQEVNHRIATEALYKSEIAQMAARHMHQEKISSILETRIMELQYQNGKLSKRLERKTKFNRVLLGVGAGLAAAIGVISLTQ